MEEEGENGKGFRRQKRTEKKEKIREGRNWGGVHSCEQGIKKIKEERGKNKRRKRRGKGERKRNKYKMKYKINFSCIKILLYIIILYLFITRKKRKD